MPNPFTRDPVYPFSDGPWDSSRGLLGGHRCIECGAEDGICNCVEELENDPQSEFYTGDNYDD